MNLSSNKVIYIARDIERALGTEPLKDYFIVTNDNPYARSIKEKYPDFVLLIESPVSLDTFELLEKEETAKFINEKCGKKIPNILVFKNTARIEEFCAKKIWRLLNPPTTLAEKIENKITQVEWLGGLAELLPKFKITPAKEIKWQKKPFVLQWAHAHTGIGTILINNEKELKEIQKQFPDRPAKASKYIKGPSFTVNIVVVPSSKYLVPSQDKNDSELGTRDFRLVTNNPKKLLPRYGVDDIAIGNISYQITGMPPFTDSPFATVGNDWSLPHSLLNERHLKELHNIAEKIGAKMSDGGWKGLFGIDVIYDEERDELKLIEINARQPASTTYESQLQTKFRGHLTSPRLRQAGGSVGSTIFEAHLAALLDLPTEVLLAHKNLGKGETKEGSTFPKNTIEINDGAQIVQRVTKTLTAQMVEMSHKIAALNKAGYTTIPYSNTKPNSDFIRIQSDKGLMEKDGKFNKRGFEIVEILEK